MSVQTRLVRAWYQKSIWLYGLLPFSLIFKVLSTIRRLILQFYHQGRPFKIPVIVIGNISIGGSGKTPFLMALAKALSQRGYRVGVVSRGYGGRGAEYPMNVLPTSDPSICGDEPLLISRSCACPVVVDPVRSRAVLAIIEQFSCDVVLSDDGLQHYSLHRDVEIAILDATRGLGNGWLLPAGPLREAVSRLSQVDFVVANGQGEPSEMAASDVFVTLEPVGLRKFGSDEVVYAESLGEITQVHAVAAIGNPERFADTLRVMGYEPILHKKDDHQCLALEDLSFKDSLPVIITAKDAVKFVDSAPDNLWVLDVEMLLSEIFLDNICHRAGITSTQS